jgi:choline dehydrogenase-like flavoprotein
MPIVDLRDIPVGENMEADVCIVGSGPAGSTIARELDSKRLRVIVVESGGIERNADVDSLNEIENMPRASHGPMAREKSYARRKFQHLDWQMCPLR